MNVPTMRFAAAGLMGLAVSMAGCLTNVPQDSKSGADKRPKGAKEVKLDDTGEGVAKDIVTYPGGDRVDWKFFTTTNPGDVDVDLKWTPARPGLDLSMNIVDANYHMIKRVKPSTTGRPHKSVTLVALPAGNYFVQVYASTRGDAGAYKLDVTWHQLKGQVAVTADALPMPPNLPAPPQPPPGASSAASGGPGGSNASSGVASSAASSAAPPPPPKKANIIKMNLSGSSVILVIDKGKAAGIDKNWNGVILVGNSDKPLAGSNFQVYQVTDDESYGKVNKLGIDEIGDNAHVLLTAPPAAGP
jgi:hypothetical protein